MAGSSEDMFEMEIGILRPEVRLELPASEDSLPVVRQALRSLGETVEADLAALEDAELAVTEACANAVEHAYPASGGAVHVSFFPREDEMLVSVRDFGRGMSEPRAGDDPGYGLSMIEGIANRMDIHGVDGAEGTEVEMAFGLGVADTATVDGAAPGVLPAEKVLRRVVAVVAAQVDMTVERVMEALLVVELVARHGLRYLVGDHSEVRVTRGEASFELRVGPFEANGVAALIRHTEVPVVGSVVERLADEVRTERVRVGDVDCEYVVLRLATRG